MSGGGGDDIDTSGGTSFNELKTAYLTGGGWPANAWTGSPGDPIRISHFAGLTFAELNSPDVPLASAGNNINIKGFQFWTSPDTWGTSTSGARSFNGNQGEIGDPESGSEG